MSNLPVVAESGLPRTYDAARAALEKCVEVDECADWADKALALAVYGRQAKDESLYKMAVRIRARAIRRAGELLSEVEPARGGDRKSTDRLRAIDRSTAATQAGLSVRQRKTALSVAAVPEASFERQVESDNPPSVTRLAKQGTKPRPPAQREVTDPEVFSISTSGQAALGVLFNASRKLDPAKVVSGASSREREILKTRARDCIAWLSKLLKAARRG